MKPLDPGAPWPRLGDPSRSAASTPRPRERRTSAPHPAWCGGASAPRREDVHQIAAEVDDWLDTHAELPGLVLHARSFPGWENISGLLEHLRFVAGHHGRIHRVALVVDGRGVDLAVNVARTLLHPEVRRFDDLDGAVRWAAVAPVEVG